MTLPTPATLQAAIDSLEGRVVGAAIGLASGTEARIATFGTTCHDGGRPVDGTARFHWGSFTKVVTAFVTCQLAERGMLRLDDAIAAYLPRIGARIAGGDAITIRMLLAHTAGLVDLFERFDDVDHLIDRLGAEGLIAPAGTLFSYSNAGFALLGALIETITGQRWRNRVTAELVQPLGLATVRFDDGLPTDDACVTQGHLFRDGTPMLAPLWPDTGTLLEAAGSTPSSAIGDILRLAYVMMTGRDPAHPARPPLLGKPLLDEMRTVQARLPGPGLLAKAWGLGWSIDPAAGTVGHMGGTSVYVLGHPAGNRCGAFLSNTANSAFAGQALLRELSALPAAAPPEAHSGPSAGDAILGRYRSPLFAIDIVRDGEAFQAITELSPEPVPLRRIGERTFVGTVMGAESVETEFHFLGEAGPATHLHVGLRALRRA